MSALSAIGRVIRAWLDAAAHILRFAPWLLLPILLTEGSQHVAEIQLGMFVSRADFIALSDDTTRIAFAQAKVAGMIISLLLVVRAVATGSAARALRPGWHAVAAFGGILLVTMALDSAFQSGAARAVAPDMLLQAVNIVLQAILVVPLVALLAGDSWADVRAAGWRLVPALMLGTVLSAAAGAPMQWLHSANHAAALAAPVPAVWALMLFDTIWVALMALMVGAGVATGWRCFVGQGFGERWPRAASAPATA